MQECAWKQAQDSEAQRPDGLLNPAPGLDQQHDQRTEVPAHGQPGGHRRGADFRSGTTEEEEEEGAECGHPREMPQDVEQNWNVNDDFHARLPIPAAIPSPGAAGPAAAA